MCAMVDRFGPVALAWTDTLPLRRAALELLLLEAQPLFSLGDWNELVKCGKNRVLIILSFLQLDW